jgi:hypothetical protein
VRRKIVLVAAALLLWMEGEFVMLNTRNALALVLGLSLVALTAARSDAQVLIDQNKAMAGGVTPDDTDLPEALILGPLATLDLNGFTISGPSSFARPNDFGVVDGYPAATHAIGTSVVRRKYCNQANHKEE